MSRIPLSDTGDWQLRFDGQDIRGFDALTADGTKVGEVDNMIVNTEAERVDAIVLEDGTEYPARDISIGEGVVYLTTLNDPEITSTLTVYDDYGHVVKREAVADGDYDAAADDFRAHSKTSGGDYDASEPAYRFGYDSAFEDANRNRGYNDSQADLRTGYAARHADRDFDADQSAIRTGYTRAQRSR